MHISNLMNLATPSFVFQPGPDSIGAFALRRLTGVVAAQACALIDLEAFKVEVVRMVDIHIKMRTNGA